MTTSAISISVRAAKPVHDGTTIKYLAKRSDCAVCPLKRQCTTGLERRISRDVHQDARDYCQALMQTEAYRVSRAGRKKIETLFGEAKHICGSRPHHPSSIRARSHISPRFEIEGALPDLSLSIGVDF
jgi:hypothetical protein